MVKAQPSPGDEAVHVGMERKGLGPGVQDGEHAGRGAEATACDIDEGLGGGGEEQRVRLPPRAQEQGVKHLGNGEDDMEVRHRQ